MIKQYLIDRKKFFRGISHLFVMTVLVFQVSGCALLFGAAAGVGGFAWVKGKLVKEMNVSLDRVHQATLTSLKRLELPITLDKKDKFTARVESKFADGTNVWIDINSLTERSSKVFIRVGVLGDQERSGRIMAAIEKAL